MENVMKNIYKSILSSQWEKLVAPYLADHEVKTKIFEAWLTQYTKINRHYHNASHISYMLRIFNQYKQYLSDPVAVEWAIWFHDFIYIPGNKNNEKMSFEFAEKFLTQLNAPKPLINRVKQLIFATKSHDFKFKDHDIQFFLDLDFAILSENPKNYNFYLSGLRLEYRIYPRFIFILFRKKWIKKTLKRKRIYYSKLFFDKEVKARDNLIQELKSHSWIWKDHQIPEPQLSNRTKTYEIDTWSLLCKLFLYTDMPEDKFYAKQALKQKGYSETEIKILHFVINTGVWWNMFWWKSEGMNFRHVIEGWSLNIDFLLLLWLFASPLIGIKLSTVIFILPVLIQFIWSLYWIGYVDSKDSREVMPYA